jgi:2-deoxy-D-gluconate 3-dehydrogenase
VAAALEGANVTFSGRDEKAGDEVQQEIQKMHGQEALFIAADLRIPENCLKLIKRAEEKFGGIDGLFNYAGILPTSSIMETSVDLLDDVMAIDFRAPFLCCGRAIVSMIRGGGGSIINTGSVHAYAGEIDRAAYACAKGALRTLTHHIAMNYARDQIRCNWITMGWVPTPGEVALRQAENREQGWYDKAAAKFMPMGRIQTIEEHIEPLIYLLSDASSQVTGTEFQMTGGFFPSAPTYQRIDDSV